MSYRTSAQRWAIALLLSSPALSQSALREVAGGGSGDRFGLCVSSLGDVNGDGSTSAVDNDLTLTVTRMPAGQNGIFVTSTEQNVILNPGGSDGHLCIASFGIGRHVGSVLQADAAGTVSPGIDLMSVPLPTGTRIVMAGDTRYWQLWFSDGGSSNSSDGIGIDTQ